MNRKERRAYAAKVRPVVARMQKDARKSGVDTSIIESLARQMKRGNRTVEQRGNAVIIGPEKNGY